MQKIRESSLQAKEGEWDALTPFDLVEIHDGREGFTFVLAEVRGERELRFKVQNIYGYRVFDESDILNYMPIVSTGIYLIIESDFQEWAKSATLSRQYPEGNRHFIVVSANGVLEYLGLDLPFPAT